MRKKALVNLVFILYMHYKFCSKMVELEEITDLLCSFNTQYTQKYEDFITYLAISVYQSFFFFLNKISILYRKFCQSTNKNNIFFRTYFLMSLIGHITHDHKACGTGASFLLHAFEVSAINFC